ncbi:MAG: T9SS type A sorting domain-containing protein [Ferruginibacter sp.]
MRKICLLTSLVAMVCPFILKAQVTVTGADAASNAGSPYTTLKAAFDQINLGSQTGNNIIISITGNTTEAASAVLNAGNWTSLTIKPSGGSFTVSGNISSQLVDLFGADNVTIDGLNTGGNALTISNTNTGAGASTIRLVFDASNNTIRNCTLLGSSGAALNSGLGTVNISVGTTTGNIGNVISNNNIGPAGTNLPICAIYSVGASQAVPNTVTVSGNNIYDYFNAAGASNGMNIYSGNEAWTITNNRLFQTGTRIYTTANTHNGIFIFSGSGYTITGNVIGFANAAGTGTTNMAGISSGLFPGSGSFPSSYTPGGTANATAFAGISCAFTAGGAVSSIQNNTIGGIALYSSSSSSVLTGFLCGISVVSGSANIGTVTGNTIGSSSGTSSIYAVSTSVGAIFTGIYCASANTITVQNNMIGGVDASATTAATAIGFKGIEVSGTGSFSVTNNSIGNATANNIRTGYLLMGGNLSNTATTPTAASGGAAVRGIVNSSTGASLSISNNTFRGFLISGTATTYTAINNTGALTASLTINNNSFGTAGTNWISLPVANGSGILGISNSVAAATMALTISNNIFQGTNYTAACSGAFQCIFSSGAVLSETFSNNNFNNLVINTTSSTIGFLISASNSTPTVSITGNYVTGRFLNSNASGSVNYIAVANSGGIPTTGSTTISGNDFSNISFRTSTSFATVIYWSSGNTPGCAHSINVTNNTINNITNSGTGSSSQVSNLYGILVSFGYINTISGNTISNLSAAGGTVLGIYSATPSTNTDGYVNVNSNLIHDLQTTSVYGTAAGTVQGIQLQGGPGLTNPNLVYKNKIYNLYANNGEAFGIYTSQATAGSTTNIYNNIIGRLYVNASNYYQGVSGIFISGTTANIMNVYYNTVYLDGSCNTQSYALYVTSANTFVDIRNNILVNTVTPAGGASFPSFVIFRGGALGSGYPSSSNNNILYAGTPGPLRLIYGENSVSSILNAQQTLAAFQTFVSPRESASKTELPPFYNTTSGIVNSYLHINPAISTQAESGAANIAGLTSDFDGEIRQGNGGYTGSGTAPDIGADEFDIAIDKLGPDISYIPLNDMVCLSNPVLSATITDASGVNSTAGTKPRIYFKTTLNANVLGATNTNTTDGWKYTEATNSNSPFSFTIDYSLIYGGVTTGSIIQYFVTAQDQASPVNVAINSGVFSSVPSGVALTGAAFGITGFINRYQLNAAVPTSITIGASGTYTTLTDANGLFQDLNVKGLSGNTTVTIIDPLVTETGGITLNQLQYACGGPYTLTIKPAASGTVLTGAPATGPLLRIKSSNVIIDGSSNGSGSQDLTISNTALTSPNVLLLGSSGSTAISNTTVKNCIIINGSNSSSAILVSDGAIGGNAGYFNNISIRNNAIQKAYIGVYVNAVTGSGNGSGLTIASNTLNTSGANSIRLCGIYVQGVDGATINGNNIGNFDNTGAENDMGIWLAAGTGNATVSNNTISTLGYTGSSSNAPVGINITSGVTNSNTLVSGNTISALSSAGTTGSGTCGISLSFASSGVTITGNNISNIKNTNASGYGATGLLLNSTQTSNTATVTNNFIFDITGIGNAGSGVSNNGCGIVINNGGGYKIYYNTVHLNTNQTAAAGLPACLTVTALVSAPGAIDLRNNIFSNVQTQSSERYCIYAAAPNTVFSNIDYNDYYTTGSNTGYLGGNQASLAAMQAAFGGNTHSIIFNPTYVSSTDLHLVTGSNCQIDGAATPLAGITGDYDADTRDLTTPDMGADEFTGTLSNTLAGIAGSATCQSKAVAGPGTSYIASNCNLIARVVPSGGSPVSGTINTCVTLDATQQYFNAEPYVQRHYDIEPVTANTTTTSATITLYFTDAEFVSFNTNNPLWPKLPTVAGGGNSDPNRSNLRVTQYHGTATTSPSTPGNYTANAGAGVLINPSDANIVWNGSYWAVTFDITGFSGFYVHSNLYYPLPISINYFRGSKQGSNHVLDWKVTCNSTPSVKMELERSASSNSGFVIIYTRNATAVECAQPFGYTDAQPLKGMNYYRLKMTDATGKISYSNVVLLLNADKGVELVNIVPNPVQTDGRFTLNISSARAGRITLQITDMMGRTVRNENRTLVAGYNNLLMNVSALAPGMYNISGITDDDKTRSLRFVKQ